MFPLFNQHENVNVFRFPAEAGVRVSRAESA